MVPICPQDKSFLVVVHRDMFWLDHVAPFGLATTSGLQGKVADAIMDIWTELGICPSAKWVDDVVLFHSPSPVLSDDVSSLCYHYNQEWAKTLIAPLGVPWHPSKGQEFDFIFSYVGFLWDIPAQTVRLTDDKHRKIVAKLSTFLDDFECCQCPIKRVLSLHGSLTHISFIFPHSRSYLSSLSSFIASFSHCPADRAQEHFPPRSFWHDLCWWLCTLQLGPGLCSLTPKSPLSDLGIWVDASTDWGVSLVWQDIQVSAWCWMPGWQHAPGCDIGWGEAITIELAILCADVLGLRDAHLLIHSDNKGIIGAFRRGRSRNFMVNQCIQCTNIVSMSRNLSFSYEYVQSEVNLADPISHGVGILGSSPIPIGITLPDALSPFLTHVS